MKQLIEKAKVLIDEALPYIQEFKGKIVVIKYGGAAMINQELKEIVMKDIAFLNTLNIRPIIVHGGGPMINEEMKKAGISPKFVDGLRFTDEKTIGIIKKVFKEINSNIKDSLKELNTKAITPEECIIAKEKDPKLGLVGEITYVDKDTLLNIIEQGKVPVISPLGSDNNHLYNINADTAATKIAIALKAEKLTIMTDVDGVLDDNELISHLSIDDASKLINRNVITKGMIPKVKACVEAVKAGCKKAHLINGTIKHSLLFEIFTEKGIGTEIVKNGSVLK